MPDFSSFTKASFCYPDPESDPEGFLAALEAVVDEHAPGDGIPPKPSRPAARRPELAARSRVSRNLARFFIAAAAAFRARSAEPA